MPMSHEIAASAGASSAAGATRRLGRLGTGMAPLTHLALNMPIAEGKDSEWTILSHTCGRTHTRAHTRTCARMS